MVYFSPRKLYKLGEKKKTQKTYTTLVENIVGNNLLTEATPLSKPTVAPKKSLKSSEHGPFAQLAMTLEGQ